MAEPLRANARVPVPCRPAFLWALVAVGAALRIFQYVSDTSFWFDEFSLVRNLVHMTLAQLATEPMKYNQVAPVGFLLAEKGISRVLGESDLAFRALLLPFGLATLALFLFLARRLLDGYAHLTAFHRGDAAFARGLSTGRSGGGPSGAGALTSQILFPESGSWRLFVQFETSGAEHTASFVVEVP